MISTRTLLAAGAATLALAGCGSASSSSSASTSSSSGAPSSAPASSPAGLTASQGAAICRDLLSWSKQAANEDQPRFTSTLIDDANEAGTTQLGNDMTSMENDLVSENSLVLEPGPPGMPSDAQMVDFDCQIYGVNIPSWGPPAH